MEKLKKIKESFTRKRIDFKLLKRVKDIVLFELSVKSDVWGYEVHKVRKMTIPPIYKEKSPDDYKGYDYMEVLSSDESFGEYGWTYQHLKNAETKMDELLKEEQNGE